MYCQHQRTGGIGVPESSYHGYRPASVIVVLVSNDARPAVRAVAAGLESLLADCFSQH